MASLCSFPITQEISLEGLRVLTVSYGHSSCQEGGELSSSGLVAHHHKGKSFHAQPVLHLLKGDNEIQKRPRMLLCAFACC